MGDGRAWQPTDGASGGRIDARRHAERCARVLRAGANINTYR